MTRRVLSINRIPKFRQPSEHELQVQLFAELPFRLKPEIVVVAIPNGSLRHIKVAMELKAEGVRRGTPDIVAALHDGRCGWLEMKARQGRLTEQQTTFRIKVERLGHYWGMARSVDEALEHLKKWGALR